MKHISDFAISVFSLAVFAVMTLAIAGTTYQVLNPDGGVVRWLTQIWNSSPAFLVLLGGIALLVNRWLNGVQGRHRI